MPAPGVAGAGEGEDQEPGAPQRAGEAARRAGAHRHQPQEAHSVAGVQGRQVC